MINNGLALEFQIIWKKFQESSKFVSNIWIGVSPVGKRSRFVLTFCFYGYIRSPSMFPFALKILLSKTSKAGFALLGSIILLAIG